MTSHYLTEGSNAVGLPANGFLNNFYIGSQAVLPQAGHSLDQHNYARLPNSYAPPDAFAPPFDAFHMIYTSHPDPAHPATSRTKRGISPFDHVRGQPDSKRQRLGQDDPRDSFTNSLLALSTATPSPDTESERSPPSTATDASPAPETLADKLRHAQAMARSPDGTIPSVLLPAHPRDSASDNTQDDAAMARASRGGQATRRFQAAAVHHLEDASPDEADADFPLTPKLKGTARRQPRKRVKPASEADDDEQPQSGGDGDEDKRAQFLERNRLAACRSRQKKKEWIKSLETQSDELTRQNGDLQMLVTALREEISTLRGALSGHNQCACQPGSSDGSPPLSAAAAPRNTRPDSNTFSMHPWSTLRMPAPRKEGPPGATSGVINLGPTGLTPFNNVSAGQSVMGYFNQPYPNNCRPFNTPALVGYSHHHETSL